MEAFSAYTIKGACELGHDRRQNDLLFREFLRKFAHPCGRDFLCRDVALDADLSAHVGGGPLDAGIPRINEQEESAHARLTRTSSTSPGLQTTSMFIGAQQTSQSSMVE